MPETVVLRLPSHLAHDGRAAELAAALLTLRERLPGGVLEGDRVVGTAADGVAVALEAIRTPAGAFGVAAAVGGGAAAEAAGCPIGLEPGRARRLVELARVGEVLLTPLVDRALPEGVGVFDAPAALSAAVGYRVRAARDYRG
jgi:hypothetical protein